MRTMPKYVTPLGQKGDELRHALGARVFSPAGIPPSPGDEDLFEFLPKTLDRVAQLVNRLKEVLEKRGGRS